MRSLGNFFEVHGHLGWKTCSSMTFHDEFEYRLKKQTVLIDGVEFPMPLRELKDYQEYWTIYNNDVILFQQRGTKDDDFAIKNGLAWLSKTDAQEAYEKLYKPYIDYTNYWRKQNENTQRKVEIPRI